MRRLILLAVLTSCAISGRIIADAYELAHVVEVAR